MSNQKKYTDAYLAYLIEFSNAEEAFNQEPTKVTATALSNLRAKKFTEEEKYTPEYLKESGEQWRARVGNYVTTVAIEEAYEKGKLSNKARLDAHERNDQNNPIK